MTCHIFRFLQWRQWPLCKKEAQPTSSKFVSMETRMYKGKMPKSRPRRTRNEIYKVKLFCKIKMPKQIEKKSIK